MIGVRATFDLLHSTLLLSLVTHRATHNWIWQIPGLAMRIGGAGTPFFEVDRHFGHCADYLFGK